MAELNTDEEQLEAIKRWWKENGTSLIAGVVIAAAGIFGWKAWEGYQANQAEAASMRYQQLLSLASQPTLEDAALAQAREQVTALNEEHDGTLYADLATLIEARLAVADGDLAGARDALSSLIDATERGYLKDLARLRLARLQLAGDEADTALSTLDAIDSEALNAQRLALRGDAQLALGQKDEARDAYREALATAEASGQPLFGTQLKLDNLGAEEATL
ncbi:YfgM family protein [Halomonas salinarum]|uniref:YfgM family protein n=1 Tax=Halomonas salinarum TaxID=1158993 RepID=UPI00143ACA62|nr:tetratricopeptide repeat protein [Halomonas salinarum]